MPNSKPQLYPVHETFTAFQGEGMYAGRAAHFIRLYGCPLRCPWCDSAGTWHPQHQPPAGVRRMTAEQLAQEARDSGVGMVVVTGGEPAIHDLGPLADMLGAYQLVKHLETSGAYRIRGQWDHVTVSPKRAKRPLLDSLEYMDTYKVVVDTPGAIREWWDWLVKAAPSVARDIEENDWGTPTVYLQPEHSVADQPAILNAITQAVVAHPRRYMAGWQLHKLYACDALDRRSAPTVPLGGTGYSGAATLAALARTEGSQ